MISRPAADTSAVLLGALTLVVALAAGTLGGTDQDPGLLAARSAAVGVLGVAGLAGTVAAFVAALAGPRMRPRAIVGLVLAVGAWPIAELVAALVRAVPGGHPG